MEINKEKFKFAASHFAIFGPACGERMHGHNYYVSIQFKASQLDENLGLAVEFNTIKPQIYETIQSLDEYVLFPENSPYLKIEDQSSNWGFEFNDKKYSLPKADVRLLPVKNISCEELSKHLSDLLLPIFSSHKNITEFTVQVEETKGQSARFIRSI